MSAQAQFLDALERVLPAEAPGISPRQAHAIVDVWSIQHVRNCLRELAAAGRAVSDLSPKQTRLYRRKQEHPQ